MPYDKPVKHSEKKRYRQLIWDWNGTLLDDTWLAVATINAVLLRPRRLQEITLDEYRAHFGFPVEKYYRKLGLDLEGEDFAELCVEFVEAYDARRHECELHPGVRTSLQTLKDNGFVNAVLSAYAHQRLVQALQAFELENLFKVICGHPSELADSKAENGRRLVASLGIPPEEVLMIGDTVHDYEVAQAMGTDCWLVTCGCHPAARLEQCGVPLLNSPAEVAEKLLRGGMDL